MNLGLLIGTMWPAANAAYQAMDKTAQPLTIPAPYHLVDTIVADPSAIISGSGKQAINAKKVFDESSVFVVVLEADRPVVAYSCCLRQERRFQVSCRFAQIVV